MLQISIVLLSAIAWNLSIGDADVAPYVAWTMDNSSIGQLFPEHKRDQRWVGDLTGLYESFPKGVFGVGVRGQAIYVRSTAVVLARNLSESECVLNTSTCSKGITLCFWIKLQSLGNNSRNEHSVIQASNTCFNALYISVTNSSLNFQAGGKTLCIDICLKDYGWTHVGVTWSEAEKEVVAYINGSKFTGREIANRNDCMPHGGNIIAGDRDGASFYLDELEIYYEALSPDDISKLAHIQSNSTSSTSQQHKQNYTRLIVMATVIPAAAVVILIAVTYLLMRKRRTRKILSLYVRQSSRNHDAHNSAADSDSEEERSVLNSEEELERLQHWFRQEE